MVGVERRQALGPLLHPKTAEDEANDHAANKHEQCNDNKLSFRNGWKRHVLCDFRLYVLDVRNLYEQLGFHSHLVQI